jgi:hypothetical protein
VGVGVLGSCLTELNNELCKQWRVSTEVKGKNEFSHGNFVVPWVGCLRNDVVWGVYPFFSGHWSIPMLIRCVESSILDSSAWKILIDHVLVLTLSYSDPSCFSFLPPFKVTWKSYGGFQGAFCLTTLHGFFHYHFTYTQTCQHEQTVMNCKMHCISLLCCPFTNSPSISENLKVSSPPYYALRVVILDLILYNHSHLFKLLCLEKETLRK